MPEPLLAELLQELDLAVIEWLPDGTFQPYSDPPRWFKGMAQWSSLPFLEHFLPEAEAHWRENPTGVLTSGNFTIEHEGKELLLRARALKLDGRLVMAIERIIGDADTRPILREARTQALAHEQLDDRAREVHVPAAAIAQAVDRLRRTALSAEQQPIVEALSASSDQLSSIARALPAARRRRRR